MTNEEFYGGSFRYVQENEIRLFWHKETGSFTIFKMNSGDWDVWRVTTVYDEIEAWIYQNTQVAGSKFYHKPIDRLAKLLYL